MKLSIPNRRVNPSTPRRRVARPAERESTAGTLFSDAELAAVNQAPLMLRAIQALPGTTVRQLRRLWAWSKPRAITAIERVRQLPLRYQLLVIGAFVLGIIVIVAWTIFVVRYQLETTDARSSTKTGTSSSGAKSGPKKAMPTFSTLTPGGSKVDNWNLVSPPGRDPVYAYTDTIDNIDVIVSQQPLPESLSKDPGSAIKDLATSYAALETLKVGNTTVYTGVSSTGPQSIIFTKNDRLILIKADKEIDPTALSDYIKSLR